MHGTSDPTVPFENVERFTKLMNDAGNTCTLMPFENAGHGFFNGSAFRKGSSNAKFDATMKQTVDFLTERFRLRRVKVKIRIKMRAGFSSHCLYPNLYPCLLCNFFFQASYSTSAPIRPNQHVALLAVPRVPLDCEPGLAQAALNGPRRGIGANASRRRRTIRYGTHNASRPHGDVTIRRKAIEEPRIDITRI